MAASSGARGPSGKLDEVTQLMQKLKDDLNQASLTPEERETALEQLKVHGRDPRNSDPIFSQDGIETLTKHAFESPLRSTARGALRVLCNAMVLAPATRQRVVDSGQLPKASSQLKEEGPKSWEDSFLLSRIILLSTYAPKKDIVSLINEHGLPDAIVANLTSHDEYGAGATSTKTAQAAQDPMQDMALNEVLRMLFNVTHLSPGQASQLTAAIPPVLSLLDKQGIPAKKPLDPPLSSIINGLLNLDFETDETRSSLKSYSSDSAPNRVVSKLVELLDRSLAAKEYQDTDREQLIPPLIGVLSSVYSAAEDDVKEFLRGKLLPTTTDREEVLGQSSSLGSALLRTSNNPMAPQLGDVVSHLLFKLSDKEPSKFVENVGFGYASGFLAKNNIAVPGNVAETSLSGSDRAVNPVTGQFIDSEQFPDMPEMTEDEKLREAERLYELFERLRATGVVDVQNPVEEAIRSGRFQQMNSDRVTEVDSD